MSKYLINESPLIVLPTLAKKIGLNESIVLQQVQYWLSNPKAGIMHDGHKWVHNTYAEWAENFPFWSESGVKKIILRLESMGLIVSAKTSPNPYDHTKSYRINYDNLDEMIAHVELEEMALRQCSQNPDDGTPEVPSIQILLTDTTNNTANEEKPSSLPGSELPLEWQVISGSKELSLPDQEAAKMKDAANLISMGAGVNAHTYFVLAYTFMRKRNIIIPEGKLKGQRKALKEMVEMHVYPEHIAEAVDIMLNHKPKPLTCVDLFSVAKIAIDLANPPKEESEHKFLEITG